MSCSAICASSNCSRRPSFFHLSLIFSDRPSSSSGIGLPSLISVKRKTIETFEPYQDVDQLLEPSKRNDKSLNQVNDLNKNCTLKRHSDVNNSATNSHIELDNNSQAHPKTPTDLPNRFSSSAHVQPNLGIPVTRGFKIASINLASLYKILTSLGSICCPRQLIY